MMRLWTKTVYIIPIGKPRATQRDKWSPSPAVQRYRAWADLFRAKLGSYPRDPVGVSWVAYLPIPPSWSKKKKAEMSGGYHRSTPDRDNIDKAILDSMFKRDEGVAFGIINKYWDDGEGPRIEITLISLDCDPAL